MANPSEFRRIFGDDRSIVVKLDVVCARCGKEASAARGRRTRCPKCKTPVNGDSVVLRPTLFRRESGGLRQLTPEEMAGAMEDWAASQAPGFALHSELAEAVKNLSDD